MRESSPLPKKEDVEVMRESGITPKRLYEALRGRVEGVARKRVVWIVWVYGSTVAVFTLSHWHGLLIQGARRVGV